MSEREKELVGLLAEECKDMRDVQALLKSLFQGTIQAMLEGEMDEHLGYEKRSNQGDRSGNSRNSAGKRR